MTTNPQFADTQAPTDFKVDLIEQARKLIAAREANQKAREWTQPPEILNTSIGK